MVHIPESYEATIMPLAAAGFDTSGAFVVVGAAAEEVGSVVAVVGVDFVSFVQPEIASATDVSSTTTVLFQTAPSIGFKFPSVHRICRIYIIQNYRKHGP